MRPRLLLVVVGVAGVLMGAATALALRSPALPAVSAPPSPLPVPSSPPDAEQVRPAPPQRRVLLVWSAGGLPAGLGRQIRRIEGVRTVTTVTGDRVDLVGSQTAAGRQVDVLEPGWSLPLDAFAIDIRTYRPMVPVSARPALDALAPGTVLLSTTSARLRGLGTGDELTLARGGAFTVAGVIDDTLVGAAEVVVGSADASRTGVEKARFLLVDYAGRRARVEAAIRRFAPAGTTRIRGPGEAPYLRHGDAVLPQSILKGVFGEFAYRPGDGREFTQDPAWQAANIVDADVPILGSVRCHRAIVPALRGALQQLVREGLGHLVDPEEYRGCWNPRLVVEGGGLSRHAWGIAVDLNATANPTGLGSAQDRRLVAVMERWGFTWGGFWLVPDPMHFEYVQPPAPSAAGSYGTSAATEPG